MILHVLVAIAIIALVLMQHGKGADIGATFGSGASNTMFGSQGSLPFLVKVTAVLAAIFFATSLGLGYMIGRESRAQGSDVNAISRPVKTVTPPASLPLTSVPLDTPKPKK